MDDKIIEQEFIGSEEELGGVRRIAEGWNNLKYSSDWILGFVAKRYKRGLWIATIMFNPFSTSGPSNPGGKTPVTLYGASTQLLYGLKKAPSPGRYYIKEISSTQNASGHGGGKMKTASSLYKDLQVEFVKKGLKKGFEDNVIPPFISKHIKDVEKAKQLLELNPERLLGKAKASTFKLVKKVSGVDKILTAKVTKSTIKISKLGVKVASMADPATAATMIGKTFVKQVAVRKARNIIETKGKQKLKEKIISEILK